jgi:hypothetical protein
MFSKTVIIGEHVEFIYCGCGCQNTRPKYDKKGRERKLINGHRKIFDLKYYFCVNCGSTKTQERRVKRKDGTFTIHRDWRVVGKNMLMCLSCYKKIFRREHFRRLGKERFRFKGVNIQIKHQPRIEVCNCCRGVVPFDVYRTMLHHEYYDDSDKIKHTIEVCLSCHNKITWELGQFKKKLFP